MTTIYRSSNKCSCFLSSPPLPFALALAFDLAFDLALALPCKHDSTVLFCEHDDPFAQGYSKPLKPSKPSTPSKPSMPSKTLLYIPSIFGQTNKHNISG